MTNLLEEAKKVFLTDVDEETYQENLEAITVWEKDLRENESLAEWQQHDVTKKLIQKTRQSYLDASLQLINKRDLTEQKRLSLYAEQDACRLILALTGGDPTTYIKELNKEIRSKINLFSG